MVVSEIIGFVGSSANSVRTSTLVRSQAGEAARPRDLEAAVSCDMCRLEPDELAERYATLFLTGPSPEENAKIAKIITRLQEKDLGRFDCPD